MFIISQILGAFSAVYNKYGLFPRARYPHTAFHYGIALGDLWPDYRRLFDCCVQSDDDLPDYRGG